MSTPTPAQNIHKMMRARKRGEKTEIGERRLRRLAHGRKEFFHRVKNGIYDPITYFHVVDVLLTMGNDPFRTRDFVAKLQNARPQLAWDTTTVGRILNDLSESFFEANRRHYISTARRWNGMIYVIEPTPECFAAMLHLLDDLFILSSWLVDHEKRGEAPKRLNSPLTQCPSLNPLARPPA